MVLRDPEAYPSDERLEAALKGGFAVFAALRRNLAAAGCHPEWRYYNDGKAWLCKLLAGKRNLGWLHVYDGFCCVTVYFTQRHRAAVVAAEIPQPLKEAFARTSAAGRLIPLCVRVADEEDVDAAMAVFRLKKGLN